MAEEIKSLDDLRGVVTDDIGGVQGAAPEAEAAPVEPQRDELGRAYATGKRKDAIARVWIKPGSGKVMVNGKEMAAYFARPVLQMILRQPFQVAGVVDQFDVMATVKGGGLSGQAGAVKHGVSKALQLYDPSLRGALKAAGFLTRDSRVVERKKFGRAKARKSFQFFEALTVDATMQRGPAFGPAFSCRSLSGRSSPTQPAKVRYANRVFSRRSSGVGDPEEGRGLSAIGQRTMPGAYFAGVRSETRVCGRASQAIFHEGDVPMPAPPAERVLYVAQGSPSTQRSWVICWPAIGEAIEIELKRQATDLPTSTMRRE